MVTGNHQHATEIKFVSTLQGRRNHQHDTLEDVLSKSIANTNGKVSASQDHTKILKRIDGVVMGRLMEAEASKGVWVDYPDSPSNVPLLAASVVAVSKQDVGREVVLAFESGDPTRPILIGLIHQPRDIHDGSNAETATNTNTADSVNVQLDGKRLTLTADKEIVLSCGEASITLTRAGKVLIRGAFLLSRSSGVNRIKGASIQMN